MDPVGLVVVQADLAGLRLEAALAAIAARPDEPRRQIDDHSVIFAGHGILQRLASRFTNAVDVERALHAGAGDGDLRLLERDDLHRRAKQLPRQSAELT